LVKNNLPEGWTSTSLKIILNVLENGARPKGGVQNILKGIPSIGGEHLTYDGNFDFKKLKFIPESFYDSMTRGKIKLNDVLIVKDGATTGKTSLVKQNFPYKQAAINEHVFLLRGMPEIILQSFLFYFILSYDGQKHINKKSTGLIGGINISFVNDLEIPIPPLNEQKRIIGKIKEFMSKIDSIIANLKKIQNQLRTQKQSLLKSAFIGDMTNEFRKKNPSESSESLIQKISELQNNQEKKLQKIPLPENETDFHSIPESWKWVHVGNICTRLQYGTSKKSNKDSTQIPVLGMGNIMDGKLSFENLKYLPKNFKELDEYLLEHDDLLFNRTNSAELVGKTAIYKKNHPKSIFASYLIRAKVDSNIFLPSLLSHYVNSLFGRFFIKSVVSQQVGQANVNGTKFSMMVIPLIPLKEQKILLEKIEIGISSIDKISDEVKLRLDSLKLLKLSILKQAFVGKLVIQDPNDKPASELLEKIQLEIEKSKND
jgi:type I restriction enzyme, S subunit